MWRRWLSCSLWLALAACDREPPPAPVPVQPPAPVAPEPAADDPELAAHQPKPGERVRQPLLDDHCAELTAPVAFYYHGGRPFAQRALSDGCRPLYITECGDNGECSQSSEQEQGMWCCAASTQHAHAEAPHQ
jgi:hypothetical protein